MDVPHKGWLSDLGLVPQIAIALAGFEAEQAFKPPGRKEKAKYDFREVRRLLQANGTLETEPAGQHLCEQGRAAAVERLLEYEAKVWGVARHLLEHHHLNRDAFEALMAE